METVSNLHFQGSYSEDNEVQVVAFTLGQEEYAVDILYVLEINRLLNITRVPRAEKHVEGVVNLRGNIIPIINLHIRFNIDATENEEDKRIIVFQLDDMKVGIIVDQVSEVLRLNKNDIEETDKVYSAKNAEHIKGIAKFNNRLLLLLDLFKILE